MKPSSRDVLAHLTILGNSGPMLDGNPEVRIVTHFEKA
jgi:hypothetical protein